jgi:hypothetical protein
LTPPSKDQNRWIYFLPLPILHLCACIAIWSGNLVSGVHDLIMVDFPLSMVVVILGWRHDSFLFLFGILGTIWWYLLSWLVYTGVRGLRQPG